ncbi:DNA polymerase I [Candidatus Giovannonibacteria bacterium]|nr:DNA polymerase I [Candidatus Giovannonibacteria bacterium]
MPKKNERLVLLDMHAILHRAFHALPAFSSPKGEPTGALYGFTTFLLKVFRELKPDYLAAAYDLPAPTFRHAAYDKYKIQRPEMDSSLAVQIKRSKDILEVFGIKFFENPKFEADDVLGTFADKTKSFNNLEVMVASGDLDTLQLAEGERVKVFTLRKGINDTVIYDEKKVKERYGFGPKLLADYKGLRGDPSDNIPGVPGIGEKSASELIIKFGNLEKIFKAVKKDRAGVIKAGTRERIVKLLEEHEEEAFFSRELGSIRRDVPIELDLEKLRWRDGSKKEKIAALFKGLGFLSLLSRIPAESSDIPASKPPSLFDISEENSDFLAREEKIFWHQSDGKLYASSSAGKIFAFEFTDKKLIEVFSGEKKVHYFFDAKKILHFLKSLEISPKVYFDIKVAAWLSRPALQNPSLETTIHSFMPREVIDKGEILKSVGLLPELARILEKELNDKKLLRVWEEIELPLVPVLLRMEGEGILVDTKMLEGLSREFEKEIISFQKKIWEICGTEFNINSPKQLSEVLFGKMGLTVKGLKKTGTGAKSTRESELLKLKGIHPVIAQLLSFRELSKLKSTYLDTLPKMADASGRVHTTYDQTGAATGRLSSSSPNLQNIPIRSEAGKEIRKAFLARPGFELLAFDYSQIELRIAAILSKDKKVIKAFREGKDIHAITAAEVFNVPENKVTDNMRREAKVINFGILYGMGINALSQALEVPREKAQEFWDEYFRDFEGIREFIEKTKADVRKNGYVQTLFGRRRYLPEIYSQAEYIRKEAERMAVNAPIQGTAADIVKFGMIRSDELIEKKFKGEVFQLLQIHDELLFEVKKDLVPEFEKSERKILEGIYEGDLVLKVEVKRGPNWGEMKKYGNMNS